MLEVARHKSALVTGSKGVYAQIEVVGAEKGERVRTLWIRTSSSGVAAYINWRHSYVAHRPVCRGERTVSGSSSVYRLPLSSVPENNVVTR